MMNDKGLGLSWVKEVGTKESKQGYPGGRIQGYPGIADHIQAKETRHV